MTSEQRLDRLEGIAKLFVRAGLRERRNRRQLDEKINIIINAQIANEERFAQVEEQFARTAARIADLVEAQRHTDRRLVDLVESRKLSGQRLNDLVEPQKLSDQRLAALIEIVAKNQNGRTH